MPFKITLVATAAPLSPGHIAIVADTLHRAGYGLEGAPAWLVEHKVGLIAVTNRPALQHIIELRALLADDAIDIFATPLGEPPKKLLLADMDSTIVTGETLDELAAHAGLKDKIAAITARAMNGELDFKAALRERVAMLKDLPESALTETLDKTMLSPGAEIFVRTMKQAGATCVLVSGGFTIFTEAFAAKAGFDYNHGNSLLIESGKLTGMVGMPILDKDSKLSFLHHYCNTLDIRLEDTLTIGDGANDLPMLQAAGLGIGYRPKPVVQQSLENCIIHGDLTTALYAQGFSNFE